MPSKKKGDSPELKNTTALPKVDVIEKPEAKPEPKVETEGVPEVAPPPVAPPDPWIDVFDQGKGAFIKMKQSDVERLRAKVHEMDPGVIQEQLAKTQPSDFVAPPGPVAPPPKIHSDMMTPFFYKPMGPIIKRYVTDDNGKRLTDAEAQEKGWIIIVDRYGTGDLQYEALVTTREGPRILTVEYQDRELGGEKKDEDKLPCYGNMMMAIGQNWDADADVIFGKSGGKWGFVNGDGKARLTNTKGEIWDVVCLQARLAWTALACARDETTDEFILKKTHTKPSFYKFAVRKAGQTKLSEQELAGLLKQKEEIEKKVRSYAGLPNPK